MQPSRYTGLLHTWGYIRKCTSRPDVRLHPVCLNRLKNAILLHAASRDEVVLSSWKGPWEHPAPEISGEVSTCPNAQACLARGQCERAWVWRPFWHLHWSAWQALTRRP